MFDYIFQINEYKFLLMRHYTVKLHNLELNYKPSHTTQKSPTVYKVVENSFRASQPLQQGSFQSISIYNANKADWKIISVLLIQPVQNNCKNQKIQSKCSFFLFTLDLIRLQKTTNFDHFNGNFARLSHKNAKICRG